MLRIVEGRDFFRVRDLPGGVDWRNFAAAEGEI